MRVLALDYGEARCGCAVSDRTGTIATPIEPVPRPSTRKGLRMLNDLVDELGAEVVLVGLPVSLDGGDSLQTTQVRGFAERLRGLLGNRARIELYDERFTTRMAQATGGEAAEDSRAAALLLEEWLSAGARSSKDAPPANEAV